MNKPAHTAGPWELSENGATIRARVPDLVGASGGATVAIADLIFGDDPTRRANGHVLAAAPEMLTALEYLLPALRSHGGLAISQSELADVERIITKARGQEVRT